MTLVKVCGLSTAETVDAAVESGADYLGFVHHPSSPRHVTIEQLQVLLGRVSSANGRYRRRALSFVLLVDASVRLTPHWNELVLDVRPDGFQLHGRETVSQIHDLWNDAEPCRIIKALPVSSLADVAAARAYEDVADHLLFDARPPQDADRPGGHGQVLDWSLLAPEVWSSEPEPPRAGEPKRWGGAPGASGPWTRRTEWRAEERKPWFLAGGLTPANVADAIRTTGAPAVDVSSGVESAPGVKDPALIKAFLQAVRSA